MNVRGRRFILKINLLDAFIPQSEVHPIAANVEKTMK